ncbi:MAG: hypothetical protein ACE5JM_14125, partial [Armatimonadota bacterium]
LITPESRQEIAEKAKAAPGLWQRVIEAAEGSADAEERLLSCAAIYQVGLVPGFDYGMTRDAYGQRGVAELMQFHFGQRRGTGGFGLDMLALPCGYDWLHELLTQAQKRELATRMAEASKHEDYVQGFNSPGGMGMILGLAFFGDGVDDAAARGIVERYWNEIWWNPEATSGRRAVRNVVALLLYLEGGGNTEGMSYYGRNFPFFPTIAAWKTATGQDCFARLGYFRTVPYWMAHSVVPRPDAVTGSYFSLPIYNYSGRVMWGRSYDEMVAAATGYLRDIDPMGASLARWWVDHSRGYENLRRGLVFGLLIGDPRVRAEAPSSRGVPKTFEMKGLNNVYMRSAWNDPDATVVAFANTRFTVRASASNAFCLWKNGGALFVYRGHTARHDYWRHHGTWALNSVIFYEGQTLVRPFHQSGLTPPGSVIGSRSDVGTLSTASEPEEYDYMRGACPGSYAADKEAGLDVDIRQAERTLIYLRPTGDGATDHIVLLDRLDSGSDSPRPHVVFNTVFEPRIGKTWDAAEDGRMVAPGQWALNDAPCVVVTNEHPYQLGEDAPVLRAHARAFLKTLYPEAIRTLKIGGEEHFMDGIHGKGSEDDNYYKSFRAADRNEQVLSGGYWRFHVAPTQPGSRHTVLTAIEATDSKVNEPGTMALLEGEELLGAQVGP